MVNEFARMYRCRFCGSTGPENLIGSEFLKSTESVIPNPEVVGSLKLLRRFGLVYPWERGTENKL
jgi:hypothetical protein